MRTKDYGLQAAMDAVDAERENRRVAAEKFVNCDAPAWVSPLFKRWVVEWVESDNEHEHLYAEKAIQLLTNPQRLLTHQEFESVWGKLSTVAGERDIAVLIISMAAVDGPGHKGRSPQDCDRMREDLEAVLAPLRLALRRYPELWHLSELHDDLQRRIPPQSDDKFFGKRNRTQHSRYFAAMAYTSLRTRVRPGCKIEAPDLVRLACLVEIPLELHTAQDAIKKQKDLQRRPG